MIYAFAGSAAEMSGDRKGRFSDLTSEVHLSSSLLNSLIALPNQIRYDLTWGVEHTRNRRSVQNVLRPPKFVNPDVQYRRGRYIRYGAVEPLAMEGIVAYVQNREWSWVAHPWRVERVWAWKYCRMRGARMCAGKRAHWGAAQLTAHARGSVIEAGKVARSLVTHST
jgi:hypothetical protein